MATKREQLEKLVHDMRGAADAMDAKSARGDEPTGEERTALVRMSKQASALKAAILAEARAAKDAQEAGETLEEAKGFLSSLGINPDTKAPDNARNAKGGGAPGSLSLGEQFAESAQFKSMMSRFPGGRIPDRATLAMDPVGFKALITGASATSGGAFVSSDRTGIYDVGAFFRPLGIRDVITNGRTSSDAVEYARMTGFTNNAAPVAEATSTATIGDGTGGTVTAAAGGLKPESTATFEKVTAAVKTIAHWTAATRRSLSDAGQLRTIIDEFLTQGLEEELEDQIVAGSGTGENFQGITGLSGVQTHAVGADTVLDAYLKAKTKVRTVARARATAYLLHPNDWQQMLLLKEEGATGGYYFGGPQADTQPRMWGLPVVESEALTEGTAFVGDFRKAVLWDREQASITVSTEHADFFTRNLVAILAEMRAAFGVLQPAAIVKITGV